MAHSFKVRDKVIIKSRYLATLSVAEQRAFIGPLQITDIKGEMVYLWNGKTSGLSRRPCPISWIEKA